MSYVEHPPPAALAPWVACTWQRRADGGPPVRVVPDGCIDIVWTEGADTLVVGPNTTAFLVPLAPGVRVTGIRMRPGAAPPLLGVGGDALRDARMPVDDLWADAGRRLAATLDGSGGDVAAFAAALAARAATAPPPDPLVRAAVARLAEPSASVMALSRDLAVSERQLRRRFVAAVGYGPKRLARVLRLERALAAARAGDELARVAADAGYADQAHFAQECRALAGAPPTTLLAA